MVLERARLFASLRVTGPRVGSSPKPICANLCSSVAAITTIIFDYYETLAELRQPARERLFDGIARDVGHELPAREAYKQWVERTSADWNLRFGVSHHARPPTDGEPFAFRTFWDSWRERFGELFQFWGVDAGGEVGADAYTRLHVEAEVYPEVRETLQELSSFCRLAVLSNADDGMLLGSVERNGLTFETVVSSEELSVYKPHVSIFRQTCERMGIAPSEALYVGDTPWADVEGSRNAGMGQAWINRHDAEWPDDIEPPQHTITSLTGLVSLAG